MSPSSLYAGSTTLAPEVDLYLTHNNIFRSRIIAGANWSDSDAKWSTGLFEYSVDFSVKSFFRRYVYKDPNAEKGKLLTVRVGYGFIPDFHEAPAGGADEHRGVAELTARLPMGGQWLWTDRNKGDFRWVGEATSARYRNRLRVERSMAVWGFRGTPYTAVEGFYDTQVDRWNRVEFRGGFEFPWRYSTIFEPYYAHQAVWKGDPIEIIGFVIQKHMAMPIGGTQ
jgi:hypothetical protein